MDSSVADRVAAAARHLLWKRLLRSLERRLAVHGALRRAAPLDSIYRQLLVVVPAAAVNPRSTDLASAAGPHSELVLPPLQHSALAFR